MRITRTRDIIIIRVARTKPSLNVWRTSSHFVPKRPWYSLKISKKTHVLTANYFAIFNRSFWLNILSILHRLLLFSTFALTRRSTRPGQKRNHIIPRAIFHTDGEQSRSMLHYLLTQTNGPLHTVQTHTHRHTLINNKQFVDIFLKEKTNGAKSVA